MPRKIVTFNFNRWFYTFENCTKRQDEISVKQLSLSVYIEIQYKPQTHYTSIADYAEISNVLPVYDDR